jgi:hypothetical protein
MLTDQLLEEIEAGHGETLTRAARRVPRTRQDKAVSLSCLLRWITPGVVGPDGRRVRLEAARLAGRWVTTPGAIRRFVEAQTPHLDGGQVPVSRSQAKRQQAAERAGRELDTIGI